MCAAGSPYWTEAMNPGDLPDGETSEYKNKEMQVCMHVCVQSAFSNTVLCVQNALRAWLMPRRRLQAVHHPSHKCTLEQKVTHAHCTGR